MVDRHAVAHVAAEATVASVAERVAAGDALEHVRQLDDAPTGPRLGTTGATLVLQCIMDVRALRDKFRGPPSGLSTPFAGS